jgi:hypothetical protein
MMQELRDEPEEDGVTFLRRVVKDETADAIERLAVYYEQHAPPGAQSRAMARDYRRLAVEHRTAEPMT